MGTVLAMPQFAKGQAVTFLGGEGVIRSFKLEAGLWTYLVEMRQGPEPTFGRVGAETMILLPETELQWSEPAMARAIASRRAANALPATLTWRYGRCCNEAMPSKASRPFYGLKA